MADDDKDWEDVPPKKAGGAATAVADEWEDVPAPTSKLQHGDFQVKNGGPVLNASGFSEKSAEPPPEHTPGSVLREGALGLSSGFTGMPETKHPLSDWWTNLKAQSEAEAKEPWSVKKIAKMAFAPQIAGVNAVKGVGEGLGEMGKGAFHLNPEEFAHGAGSTIGQAAALGVIPEVGAEEGAVRGATKGAVKNITRPILDKFATPAVAPGLSETATANLSEPIARRGVENAVRASAMPSGEPNLRESFAAAAPDLAEIERAAPLAKSGKAGGIVNPDFRLRQTVENIDNHLDKLWNEQRKPQIDRHAELPAVTREELFSGVKPEDIKKIEKQLDVQVPEQVNLRDADDLLRKVNARLRRAEGGTPESKNLALELSPILSDVNDMKGTLHKNIGGLLERLGEPGVKEFNRRYGVLSESRDALRTQMNPAEALRLLSSIRASAGVGRNFNLFERLHIQPSQGRLLQKGLEDLAASNLKTPTYKIPPMADESHLLPPIPEPLGNGPDTSGPTNLPVPEGHSVVPVPGGRFVRGLLPGPIAPEAPTPPPPVPNQFKIEPIGAPTEPGRVGMRGEQGTRVPQKGLLPEMAMNVPRGTSLPFPGPLEPLQNTKPIMEGAPEIQRPAPAAKSVIPKVGEEAEPEEVHIKGITAKEAKPTKAKPTPIDKRFTSEEIADAEGMLRRDAEAMQSGEKAGRTFRPLDVDERNLKENPKQGTRRSGQWQTVGGGRDLFPFMKENPKVNPGDVLKALRNKDSAAYNKLMEKAVEFNRRTARQPDEAYNFLRELGSNPDAELEGIQEDIGGAEPTFNPEEIERPRETPGLPANNALSVIQSLKEGQQARGGILPGMEEHVAKQNEGAAKVSGENLTSEANKPKDISAAAGRMETLSPLFRGTEASPQKEIFGNTPAANTPPPAIQQAIEGTDWKFTGKNNLGLYTIEEPGTKIRVSLFERDLHPEFIRRKIAEKEKQYGAPGPGTK